MHTAEFTEIDVRSVRPSERHPQIFDAFDSLEAGQRIRLTNDHDPKPLYYQMLAERGPVFSWEYLERGPEVWRVMIEKNAAIPAGSTVGEIAASDIRKAQLLTRKGINICCGGRKSLREACSEKGLSVEDVERELEASALTTGEKDADFARMPLSALCDHITQKHHGYVSRQIPVITSLAEKVLSVHGATHGELSMVLSEFNALSAELLAHMQKEERVLFPCIRKIEQTFETGRIMEEFPFGSVSMPIRIMEMEHESAGDLLKEIRELSGNYNAPSDACGSYRLLYDLLREFEEDLHMHIHLENNILFPRSTEMEEKLSEPSL